jgi:hypothetical protein
MRAAVYARVSGEEQKKAETIDAQITFARDYCRLHGITIVDYYQDNGVTGSLPLARRPEGGRLLRDAAKNKFDLVLVYRNAAKSNLYWPGIIHPGADRSISRYRGYSDCIGIDFQHGPGQTSEFSLRDMEKKRKLSTHRSYQVRRVR